MKSNKENDGLVVVSLKTSWIKNTDNKYQNSPKFNRINNFFVTHSPVKTLSSQSRTIEEYYGWGKDVWKPTSKKLNLREYLMKITNFESKSNWINVSLNKDMKEALRKVNMLRAFYKNINREAIVFYETKNINNMLNLFYHIRNSLAHGRYTIKSNNEKEIVYIMEDATKYSSKMHVSARMIIKQSTLLKWIEIIESGNVELLKK